MRAEQTDARRRQIMDAVVDVTVGGGIQAATFRTIANRAGVSVRLVQYYFGDKDRLLTDTLEYVRADIADLIASGLAELDTATPRRILETICEALLPVDERRRRAMLVFVSFGAAAITDPSLRSPAGLRRGRELADVIAEQLRRARPHDGDVDDDALLLVMTIVGLGNGLLAGDITVEHGQRLLVRALNQILPEES